MTQAIPSRTGPDRTRLTILGIETSCDETAAAVVRLEGDTVEVLSDVVASQTEAHARYGGVVPEIAARAHVEKVDVLIAEALARAGAGWDGIDGVAATAGPGLIGGVMVGLVSAKAIAMARGIPLLAVNHLEGHALSPRLAGAAPFPYLLLLASGGHCQFIAVEGLGVYRRLGSTIDDAAGEAFDKTAKLLRLAGAGGPAVEREAMAGNAKAVDLPRSMLDRPGERTSLDLSFSGLKTAVRRAAEEQALTPQRRADICASFQAAVVDVLGVKSARAMAAFGERHGPGRTFVVAGGVAANQALRLRLQAEAAQAGFAFAAPPLRWCTDNAAMIALAGAERLRAGLTDPLDTPARARWPLDTLSPPAYGGGKKGAKA